MDKYLEAALEEARKGVENGGLPVGSVMVLDGKIVGRGRNRVNQLNSVIRHAEMDCIDNAGMLSPEDYRRSVLYTTLSSCPMCSGAVIFFNIPKVVVGDNQNFKGAEEHLVASGVEVEVLNDPDCIQILRDFIQHNPGVFS